MRRIARYVVFLLLILPLLACNEHTEFTEAALKMKQAERKQQELVRKANTILDQDVGSDPLNNLANLVYVREIYLDAEKVFKNASIVGADQTALHALKTRIDSFQPALANYAIDLLSTLTKHSIALRKQVEEVSELPYGEASDSENESVAAHLNREYSNTIGNCCLDNLYRIEPLLKDPGNAEYYALRRLIVNINLHQKEIIGDKAKGDAYLQELASLRKRVNQSS